MLLWQIFLNGGAGFKIFEKNVYILIWPLVGKKKKNSTKMFDVMSKSSIFDNWILLHAVFISRLCCGHYGNITFILITLLFPIYCLM